MRIFEGGIRNKAHIVLLLAVELTENGETHISEPVFHEVSKSNASL